MPANGRWDLIRRLKVIVRKLQTALLAEEWNYGGASVSVK